MNTEVGTAYAAEMVGKLIAAGNKRARDNADRAALNREIVRTEREATLRHNAQHWMDKALPCLPDGDPKVLGGRVVFTWPGLSLAVHATGGRNYQATVGEIDAKGHWVIRGMPRVGDLPFPTDTAEWVEEWRLDLAAWIATQQDRPLGQCDTCAPKVLPQHPPKRVMEPHEERLLDALDIYMGVKGGSF